jgi:hypothetical protein
MTLCYRVHFADGPVAYNEGVVYCFTPDWQEAREMARCYLEEEHRWDRCGYGNLDTSKHTGIIPAGEMMLFTD